MYPMHPQYSGHRDQRWGCTSYAQHGDDFMLLNLFELLGVKKGTYLDLGAHDPKDISNTALLYERGWRGVNIEANPHLFQGFVKGRPEDFNVCCGVGPASGEGILYLYSTTSGLNTMDSGQVRELSDAMGQPRDQLIVPVKTLDEIVAQYCGGVWPELLLSDIEGFDYAVLRSANLESSGPNPLVVCVETRKSDSARMKAMMEGKGFLSYCRMGENLFFVRERFYDKLF